MTMVNGGTRQHHPSQIGEPDTRGRIRVAVQHRLAPSPVIPGFEPWWVNVAMGRDPVKIVTYRPVAG
jgi:hypothetical protein